MMNKLTHYLGAVGQSIKGPFINELFIKGLFINELVKMKNRIRKPLLNPATHALLQVMVVHFSLRPSLKRYLRGVDGWMNFSIGFKTQSESVVQGIVFENGKVRVLTRIPDNVDAVLTFNHEDALIDLFRLPPNEALNLVLKNRIVLDGNPVYLQTFNFYVSLLLRKELRKELKKNQTGPVIMLDEISKSIPERVWLTKITESGGRINMEGNAISNTDLAGWLRSV